MSSRVLRCRPPRDSARQPALDRTATGVEAKLSDASHRRGAAEAIAAPRDEGEWAGLLTSGAQVLAVGAQSSLTGGATPAGGVVATTSQLREVLSDDGDRIRVQPGLELAVLQERLRRNGRWFPPVPTHDGAFVGGAVSTDAAGARTFRHGTTRRWVRGLTLMLPCGEVVELERGQVRADAQGRFVLQRVDGRLTEARLPMHELPQVPKCSAGYRGGSGLDLVDLFVGSEGTLGVLLEVELDVAKLGHGELGLLVAMPSEAAGLAAVRALRTIGEVAAIEFVDERCLSLMEERGLPTAGWLLLIQLELPPALDAETVTSQLGGESDGPAAAVREVVLREGGDWDACQVALPGDEDTRRRLGRVREAAPLAVFDRIARARRATGEALVKVGGDPIVPFDALSELLTACREQAAARRLDLAVWGHVSDGNVHPNVMPENAAELALGEDFLLAIGRKAIELGGSPLAEHGVGRHPLKQRLLRELVGDEALAAMRDLKRVFDPAGILAPGVLFAP